MVGMGQGGGQGTFSFSTDWAYFVEDPRTGRLRGGLQAPLLPSFEALIKHKSGSQMGNEEDGLSAQGWIPLSLVLP